MLVCWSRTMLACWSKLAVSDWKESKKNSLSIDAETHKKIAHESVETGRDMWELVRAAWEYYVAGCTSTPLSFWPYSPTSALP